MLALQLKIGSVLDEKSFDELNGKVFFWDNWLKKSFAELKKQFAIFFFFSLLGDVSPPALWSNWTNFEVKKSSLFHAHATHPLKHSHTHMHTHAHTRTHTHTRIHAHTRAVYLPVSPSLKWTLVRTFFLSISLLLTHAQTYRQAHTFSNARILTFSLSLSLSQMQTLSLSPDIIAFYL